MLPDRFNKQWQTIAGIGYWTELDPPVAAFFRGKSSGLKEGGVLRPDAALMRLSAHRSSAVEREIGVRVSGR